MLSRAKILYRCLYNNTDETYRDEAVSEADKLFERVQDKTKVDVWGVLFLERCVLKMLVCDMSGYGFSYVRQEKPWEAIFERDGRKFIVSYRYVAPEDRHSARTYHRVQRYTGNLGETKFKASQSWDALAIYTDAAFGLRQFFLLKKEYYMSNAFISKQDYDEGWLVINKRNLRPFDVLRTDDESVTSGLPFDFFQTAEIDQVL